MAERVVVLFGTWLVGVVIVVRALAGDLPTEISGRGVKYAEAEATRDAATASRSALKEFDDELNGLRTLVFMLQNMQIDHAEQLRRYAVRGERYEC